MKKVRIAVLGLNQGARTARDCVANEEADLVAVAGFGERAEQVAAEVEVPLYCDYKDLLANETLDAIWISLPNQLHEAAVLDALDANIKYILVDKPIASTVEEATRMIKACKEADATLLIGHHRRSSSKYQLLKQVLNEGWIGNIVGIQSTYATAKPHEYFNMEWRTTKGGGPLLINAIHDFDDLNYVTGMKPKKVYAAARNSVRGNEVEDNVSVLVEYEGGVTATYFLSDGTPGPWNYDILADESDVFCMCPTENSLRVFGTRGSFGFPSMDLYYYDNSFGYGWDKPLFHKKFGIESNDPVRNELSHFLDLALGRETTPRCSGEDALDTLKLINGIFKSIETEAVVEIQ